MPDRENEEITLCLAGETLTWRLGIAGEENAILLFHFDMEGIDLVQANAQVLTKTTYGDNVTYVFFVPEGMCGNFVFEEGVKVNGSDSPIFSCGKNMQAELFSVEKDDVRIRVLVISRALANNMFQLSDGRLVFTDGALLEDKNGIRLESTKCTNPLSVYPAKGFGAGRCIEGTASGLPAFFGSFLVTAQERKPEVSAEQVGCGRYLIRISPDALEGVKDARLQIEYTGDIGNAFINGRMIHDNFANGAVWEIGLKDFIQERKEECITIYIAPIKEGAKVNVESAMAARSEEVKAYIAELKSVKLQPVYECRL